MPDERPPIDRRHGGGHDRRQSADHVSAATLEARAYLDQAISRLDELSVIDYARLTYLEQWSLGNMETSQDLFHSLNNALFVMNVNLELLSRHLTRGGECAHAETKKWIGLMQEKSAEMATLNRKLLAASAPGEGPLYVVHSFISLRAAIQRAIDNYGDIALEKSISISWKLPDFPAIAIWTDGVAIATVLDNLVANAIKFSPPQTKIEVTMTREGKDLICAVRDEGPGLSPHDIAGIFDRRVSGESSTGFGLAVARDVVEGLGGRIWCESTEGEGSCFMFSIPAIP